jgi:diguanylate cyclase (GGDEF)-like protein
MLIDITDRKQAENDIKQREHRQRVAVDIASDFLNEPLNQIDNTIDDTLAKIGEDMQADRSYIFELDEDNTMSCKYTWYNTVTVQNDNNPNNPVEIPTWMYGRLFNQKPVLIPNVKDKDVNVSKEFKKQSIKSILWVPMIVESNVIGFLGIDCIRSKKEWKDSDILTMQLIANIVATAINRARKEKEVIYYTFHDQLTGLFNRAYFEEESKRLNVERQMPISIIIADVNGLKLINDTFGHQIGDHVLKEVSNILTENVRRKDLAARLGGDEFLVLLPNTDKDNAEKIAKRIKDDISSLDIFNKDYYTTVSIGAAALNRNDDIESLLKRADDALYKAKDRGRNRIEWMSKDNLSQTLKFS